MQVNETAVEEALDPLEKLRADHRATARYGIIRHGMGPGKMGRVQTPLDHHGLTWDVVQQMCEEMNKVAFEEAGRPSTNWGLTQYFPKLETPIPERYVAPPVD